MGQLITVTSRPGTRPETMLFQLDRSLTGMAIERYPAADAVHAHRPPDLLARRLFDLGATSVTVFSSAVTVEMPAPRWPERIDAVRHAIEHLFEHYGAEAGESPEARGVAAGPESTAAAPG